ncbi:peptide-methionine (S)-S-oxide reductase MsrA [Alkalisalibacterium limincola]|uniref:Peptide methionine sulfoxide reductase MsrA n=1 Tax=Alkalisalibacterium limincola TaxID=2699169 RepID=A0A5C8KMV2_9GAMM|nr:peptide-methionine (S)-S-oxide reductase MsrA [Alkalisalibacterium limincola]TXK60545.1 peptide-methionine (S)-S-oxide reductase MsrA [Alkalisalibacterium limincola]
MLGIGAFKQRMPLPEDALQGRPDPVPVAARHVVLDAPLDAPFEGLARIHFGMGCFWGAERLFWSIPGVRSTAVGYAGGYTANPTYHEVCSGMTGHSEVVRVVYDPAQVPVGSLLKAFWEGHDPTQGMRQGNDAGTQYRSVIHCYDADQYEEAQASLLAYQSQLQRRGFGGITTEVRHPPPSFYFAEDEHQQYLAKHPGGYCGLGGTGVACPVGLGAAD